MAELYFVSVPLGDHSNVSLFAGPPPCFIWPLVLIIQILFSSVSDQITAELKHVLPPASAALCLLFANLRMLTCLTVVV